MTRIVLLAALLLATTSAHAAVVISVPTSGSWSYSSSNTDPGFFSVSANGTSFPNGFHFTAGQSSDFPPLGVPFLTVQYMTGTFNFAGFSTLNLDVTGQVGGAVHIAWQVFSGSNLVSSGTDGGVINIHALNIPLPNPAVTVILSSNHSVAGFSQFTADLVAVPAPPALPLFATGLGMLGWLARRRRCS
jgi:hypothetical protein